MMVAEGAIVLGLDISPPNRPISTERKTLHYFLFTERASLSPYYGNGRNAIKTVSPPSSQ